MPIDPLMTKVLQDVLSKTSSYRALNEDLQKRVKDLERVLKNLVERVEQDFANKETYLWNLVDEDSQWIEYRNAKELLKNLHQYTDAIN